MRARRPAGLVSGNASVSSNRASISARTAGPARQSTESSAGCGARSGSIRDRTRWAGSGKRIGRVIGGLEYHCDLSACGSYGATRTGAERLRVIGSTKADGSHERHLRWNCALSRWIEKRNDSRCGNAGAVLETRVGVPEKLVAQSASRCRHGLVMGILVSWGGTRAPSLRLGRAATCSAGESKSALHSGSSSHWSRDAVA